MIPDIWWLNNFINAFISKHCLNTENNTIQAYLETDIHGPK